jgi:cytochrome c nitrite reductase small subunit
MASRERWLIAAGLLVAGLSLGLGLYTFRYAEGLSYLSNDPAACMNCHVMREHVESWVGSSHHAVATCNDCHVPHALLPKYLTKLDNGYHHSAKFTLQNFAEPIRIRPVNLRKLQQNCLECHGALVQDIVDHREARRGELRCTECHRWVGHMALR